MKVLLWLSLIFKGANNNLPQLAQTINSKSVEYERRNLKLLRKQIQVSRGYFAIKMEKP
jgi:hypothetical protein